MTEPGWYPDYSDATRLRYHDGAEWTEHTHSPEVTAWVPTESPAASATITATKGDPIWAFALLGIFAGIIFGGLLFNGLGSITPVTEEPGTVRGIEIEYSRTSSGRSSTPSYILTGQTDGGREWRISDEDAYNTLLDEGYPQQVVVSIGDWTGAAERLEGRSFSINNQTTSARVGWAIALVLVAVVTMFSCYRIWKSPKGERVSAAAFALFVLPGSWFGFQAFQWFQT